MAINATVTIVLDKERKMKVSLNAMILIEELTGKNLMNGKQQVELSLKDIRCFLYALLKDDDPTLTLEQTGALVTIENMGEITQKISEAWGLAMPKSTAGENKTPLAGTPQGGTG